MATLRKSCRNCASSKRHCTVQLPSCARCVQKRLTCTYILQPLSSNADAQNKCAASQLLGGAGFDTTGYCLLSKAESSNQTYGPTLDPAFCPPGHKDAHDLMSLCFLQIPELLASQAPAVFVHPSLRNCLSPLSLITHPLDSAAVQNGLQNLAVIDITTVSLDETLTALQTLLVLIAPMLVSAIPSKQEEAESQLNIAQNWAEHLLSIASAEPLRDRTPWQQWLLAESIRRTIVMAYVLVSCFNAWKYGYCSNWLLIESLPFDSRPGLWMAKSPQAWIAAAAASTGKLVGTELVSVHGFGRMMDEVDSTFCGDTFLSMIAMAHNGSGALHTARVD